MPRLPSPTISLSCANIVNGQYRYIGDLLSLASVATPPATLRFPEYHTPICIQWEKLIPFLACHPDQTFAAYILNGLTSGFRIGFDPQKTQLKSHHTNHPSSLANKNVVQERISSEISAGRLYGPLSQRLIPAVHVSPLGLVPKAHQSNKWRLIVDLSCPAGRSINDGIAPGLCSYPWTMQSASFSSLVGILNS